MWPNVKIGKQSASVYRYSLNTWAKILDHNTMGGLVNFSCFTPISFQFRIHIMSITSDSDLVIVLHTGISSCKLCESKVETIASEYPEVGNITLQILCAWLRGAKRRYSPSHHPVSQCKLWPRQYPVWKLVFVQFHPRQSIDNTWTWQTSKKQIQTQKINTGS